MKMSISSFYLNCFFITYIKQQLHSTTVHKVYTRKKYIMYKFIMQIYEY